MSYIVQDRALAVATKWGNTKPHNRFELRVTQRFASEKVYSEVVRSVESGVCMPGNY